MTGERGTINSTPTHECLIVCFAQTIPRKATRLLAEEDLDIDTGLDVDRSDLLDDFTGAVEVNDALVDAHLKTIPCVGTLSIRSLAGGDLEFLRRQAHGARDLQVLVERVLLDVGAHLLHGFDIG